MKYYNVKERLLNNDLRYMRHRYGSRSQNEHHNDSLHCYEVAQVHGLIGVNTQILHPRVRTSHVPMC